MAPLHRAPTRLVTRERKPLGDVVLLDRQVAKRGKDARGDLLGTVAEELSSGEQHERVAGKAVPGAGEVASLAVQVLNPDALVPLTQQPVRRVKPGVAPALLARAPPHGQRGQHGSR